MRCSDEQVAKRARIEEAGADSGFNSGVGEKLNFKAGEKEDFLELVIDTAGLVQSRIVTTPKTPASPTKESSHQNGGDDAIHIEKPDKSFDNVVVTVNGAMSVSKFEAVVAEVTRIARVAVHIRDVERPATDGRGFYVDGNTMQPSDALFRYPGCQVKDSDDRKRFEVIISVRDTHSPPFQLDRSTIQQQARQYRQKGMLFLPGFIPREKMGQVGEAADRWRADLGAKVPYKYLDKSELGDEEVMTRIERFVHADSKVTEILFPPALVELLKEICDQDMPTLFKDKLNFKLSGGKPDLLHQDAAAGWEDYTKGTNFINVAYFIDDNTQENAAMSIQSTGKHPRELMGKKFELLPNAVPLGIKNGCKTFLPVEDYDVLLGPAGSIAIFDAYVPHGSPANLSEAVRRNIYLTFNARKVGDFYEQYYKDKLGNYPPNNMREEGQHCVYKC